MYRYVKMRGRGEIEIGGYKWCIENDTTLTASTTGNEKYIGSNETDCGKRKDSGRNHGFRVISKVIVRY